MNDLLPPPGAPLPGGAVPGGSIPERRRGNLHEQEISRPYQGRSDAETVAAPARRYTARDLLVAVFYHMTLLRTCVVAGLALGIAACVLAKTSYTADTVMLVLIGAESTAAQDGATGATVVSVDGLKVVQSELQVIQTEQVLRPALDRVGPAVIYPELGKPRLFGLLPARDAEAQAGAAMQKFRSDLRVDSEPGSNLVRISFSHPDRDIAIKVVQAMLDSYLAKRREIYASTNSTFLDQEINRYRRHLAGLESEIQKLRVKYDVLDMAQDIVLATNRLDGIVQRQNQVRERRVAVQTEIVAVRANLATQPETVMDFRETSNNTGNDEARNTLVRLLQERTHLTVQYGANWPAVKEIEQKIETVKAQIAGKGQSLYVTDRTVRNPALNVLTNRLAALEVEDKALGQQLEELTLQSDKADQRIKSLREADGQLHTLTLTRDVAEGIYRQLSVRQPGAVFQDNVVDERNANLRVVQQPEAPIIGRSMAISYLIGGVFLGLVMGIAASVIASMLRQVYISPAEAERDLSLPSLGEFTAAASGRGDAGDLGALAAMLQDITVDGRRLSSLQVVGLSPGDGRVAMIRALGAELAAGYEQRTLILDLQSDGRAHALALGEAGASEKAQPGSVTPAATKVAHLFVGLGGAQSVLADPHAPMGRTRAALDALRAQFDMVLVIAAGDPSGNLMRRLASLVDASLIVLQAEHTRAPVAARLCSTIFAAGGNMLGFVFTGRRYYVPNWLYRWT